jgi:hypothetical protein
MKDVESYNIKIILNMRTYFLEVIDRTTVFPLSATFVNEI